MRPLAAVTALGLLVGHVLGQFHDGFGIMTELAQPSLPAALARPPVLAKRDGACAVDSHPCSDVNSTVCCDNTQFCILDLQWNVQCCPIGTNCNQDTPCNATQVYTNFTTATTVGNSVSVATLDACAPRNCTSSYYTCPGGACCPFGQNCATDAAGSGVCIYTLTSTSNTASATSSANTTIPTTDPIVVTQSQGLSTGAKAGIAIGVVLLAALVIGALTYFCIRRRRSARSETTAQELPSVAPAGRGRGGDPSDNGIRPVTAGRQMSEVDGYSYGYAPSSTHASNVGVSRGDYFGPSASEQQRPNGPDDVVMPVEIATRGPSVRRPHMDSHGSAGSEGDHSEMDASSRGGPSPVFNRSNSGSGQQQRGQQHYATSPVESIAGRFELYGDYTGTPASGQEVFHDAQESVGGARRRGGGGAHAGSSGMLPQPFPTSGSEVSDFSDFATPGPMSQEEEARLRREG